MSRNNRRELEIHSLTLAKYLAHRSTEAECAAALQSIEEGLQPVKQHHNTPQAIQFLAVKVVALKCAGRLNKLYSCINCFYYFRSLR